MSVSFVQTMVYHLHVTYGNTHAGVIDYITAQAPLTLRTWTPTLVLYTAAEVQNVMSTIPYYGTNSTNTVAGNTVMRDA